jgi:hypothetical protein
LAVNDADALYGGEVRSKGNRSHLRYRATILHGVEHSGTPRESVQPEDAGCWCVDDPTHGEAVELQ